METLNAPLPLTLVSSTALLPMNWLSPLFTKRELAPPLSVTPLNVTTKAPVSFALSARLTVMARPLGNSVCTFSVSECRSP